MNTKGFIQIPLVITLIASILVLGGVGYLGHLGFQQYKNKQSEGEQKSIELQKKLEATQKEVDALKITNNQKQNVEPIKPAKSTVDVVREWRKRVVFVVCDDVSAGSGTLIKTSDLINVITNEHVVDIEENIIASNCDVILPFEEIGTWYMLTVWGKEIIKSSTYDLATIPLKNSNDYTKKTSSTESSICKEKAKIGDSVLILGYPGIGSYEDITVTEGIISGYDDEYYITSAKVEHGNSGGAAILVKDSCYLGIPTLSVTGEIESLARILDARIALGLVINAPNPNLLRKSGTITIYNDSSTNQTIIRSTRFTASNGLVYRTQETVTVPAFGTKDTKISSDGNGYEYELICSTINPCILKIPGFQASSKYDQIYGKAFLPIKN